MPVVNEPSLLPYDARRAVRHLREQDPILAGLIDRVGPCRLALAPFPSTFDALAQAIVHQQLAGAAARAILGRLRTLAEDQGALDPARVLAADDAQLRAVGLSRPKIASIRDVAERHRTGTLPDVAALAALDDEAIVELLSEVKGVGRWTVEMLLIFRLGRPDVLPVADFGVRKGYALAFGKRDLPKPRALAQEGERWRPFRSVASWYLWRATDTPA